MFTSEQKYKNSHRYSRNELTPTNSLLKNLVFLVLGSEFQVILAL
jgi:hypothetical protein